MNAPTRSDAGVHGGTNTATGTVRWCGCRSRFGRSRSERWLTRETRVERLSARPVGPEVVGSAVEELDYDAGAGGDRLVIRGASGSEVEIGG
jgi:hypothetical protein